MKRQLITSIAVSRQASTLLLTNVDQTVDHRFSLDQLLSGVSQEAFLPPGERDLFNLVPEPVILGDINPNFTGLLFLDSQLEKAEIVSKMFLR